MNFYIAQVQKITRKKYPKDDLTQQVVRAKQYMDQHYAERICLDRIAQQAFLSKYHFIRLFKNYYGYTPFQHLTAVRIQAARRLLQQQEPVAFVCMATGFESVPTFTTLFKKSTGITPARFQQQLKKNVSP